jgi:DNA polymerase elongation subunit (family B)
MGTMLFLWSSSADKDSRNIKLDFYDSEKQRIKSLTIGDYKPYFLAPRPLSDEEHEAVLQYHGSVQEVSKRDLFSDQLLSLARVECLTPRLLIKLNKNFGRSWEIEIPYDRSYIFDENLTFGAPYTLRSGQPILVKENSSNMEGEFSKSFNEELVKNPRKYEQIREWFELCHQPVPNVSAELFGDNKAPLDSEQLIKAFLLSRLVNIPIPEAHRSRRVSEWIKSMIYTHLRRHGYLIPTPSELRKGFETSRVPGALTIEPMEGTYFNMTVCDFESLYPSCIDRFNLSYETIDCLHEECKSNTIPEIDHHICTRRKGFYSMLIGALKDLRIRWFKPIQNISATSRDNELAQTASRLLKLITVSSYGVTVRIHGVACPPLAESITAFGRWALKSAWKIAKELGMFPVYGDTDSIFLDKATDKQVTDLIGEVKQRLGLDLAIEKRYQLCVLSSAKKAYFGIKEDGSLDLRGLTAVKSNAPNFIQNTFRRCVEVLRSVRNIEQYESAKKEILQVVKDAKDELRRRNVRFQELVYSTKLYHDPVEKSTSAILPQAYQCARQMIDGGEAVKRGDVIRFVKVRPFNYQGRKFTVKPVTEVKNASEINIEDYIRNLSTSLEQTLKPMGIQLEQGSKLSDWF